MYLVSDYGIETEDSIFMFLWIFESAAKVYQGNPVFVCEKILDWRLIDFQQNGLMWTYRKHFCASPNVKIFQTLYFKGF